MFSNIYEYILGLHQLCVFRLPFLSVFPEALLVLFLSP